MQYQKMLVSKVESFIGRLRWKLFNINNPGTTSKQTYGFKTTNPPPQQDELKSFEEDMFALAKNIQFRQVNNSFSSSINEKIKTIHDSKDVLVKADKSKNIYQIPVAEYRKVLQENITADYKKSTNEKVLTVNKEASKITSNLKISDRVDNYIQSDAFLTIKDHKQAFPSRVECRLLNPAKSNIGIISKQILEEAVAEIKLQTKSNQFQNSNEVISWFKSLENKQDFSFLKFDVVSFYPSISQHLFEETITWARTHYNFTEESMNIILNARKSFLFFNNQPWEKKGSETFDVTMGSYDGAEICELVGLYILHKLEDIIPQKHLGIYRDDGLAVLQGSGPQLERTRKNIIAIFKAMNLRVTAETNITSCEFLDVYLDLRTCIYKPYRKKDEKPTYISKASNHPPTIKKHLPSMISNRLSSLSCSKEVFLDELPVYKEALRDAGYEEDLEFNPPKYEKSSTKRNNRKRKVLWFNPPFSQTVKTNVGAKFLNLIDKHFKGTKHEKYFNRKTIKVSYSCLPNLEAIISGHNKKLLTTIEENASTIPPCNCRGGTITCPLGGRCLVDSVVYKAKVNTMNSDVEATYIGAATNFKERYRNHTLSFKHQRYQHNTNLSSYVWSLKAENKPFNIQWSIAGKAPSYNPSMKCCKLCLLEKTLIMKSNDQVQLNKRSELMSKCRHRAKFTLKKAKPHSSQIFPPLPT